MKTQGGRSKVVVLGAGMIGSAVAQDLAANDGLEVHLADSDREGLDRVIRKAAVKAHHLDLANRESLRTLLKDFDLAIGALPSVIGLQTVEASIEAGCHIVDISFMSEDARVHDARARERRVIAITDCGVAPGLSNLTAAFAVSQFDTCERLEMAVGGLPAARTWPFHYKAGFAPWDVIEEYTRPARVVEDGQLVVKEALSGLKSIEVKDVGRLESFLTDGLRSLLDTLKVPFMEERTLRWPGHAELMKVFRETGYFSLDPIVIDGGAVRPRDLTAALLFPKWKFEEGEADITVMQVQASGARNGRNGVFRFDFLDRYHAPSGLRSMSRSTGFTATAIAGLVLDGTLSEPGVHVPEMLLTRPAIFDRVLGYLRARGIQCDVSLPFSPEAGS